MDSKTSKIKPDYIRLYKDIIADKCPDQLENFKDLLSKDNLTDLEIIYLNDRIFDSQDQDTKSFNQKLRHYSKDTILKILAHQKKHKLNNKELASYYNLSRNTITKWKKIFILKDIYPNTMSVR